MAYKIQELRDFSPASLRILNDNIRMLNLKIFGDVGLKDFNEPLRTEFNSKISEGNLSSLIEQNADSVKIAIDSTDGAGKVKSACFEVTDEHAQYSSNDGSYVEFVPSQTGLKWHKQAGDTGKDYHYLNYMNETTVTTTTPATITLPSEFKGKDFKISASVKTAFANGDSRGIYRINAYASNIDTANGTFKINGECLGWDGSYAITISYIVIA